MAVNIAINGFGRIGRLVFCQLLGEKDFEIVAINDTAKPELLAWLLKYETPQGGAFLAGTVDSGPDFISIGGKNIKIFAGTDPAKLPWKKLKVDLVLDCSSPSREKAAANLVAGAKKVLLVPPAIDDGTFDAGFSAILCGINETGITRTDRIISAASPTVGSLAPLIKALNDFAPIQSAILGIRDSRGVAVSISRIISELQGKLTGSDGGIVTGIAGSTGAALLTAVVKGKNITAEAVNRGLHAKIESSRILVLPVGEDLYQVQFTVGYGNEASYTIQVVKILKYFAGIKAGPAIKAAKASPVNQAGGTIPARPGTPKVSGYPKPAVQRAPPAEKTRSMKGGSAKTGGQKPAGGAKSSDPALPRKPLINFPK